MTERAGDEAPLDLSLAKKHPDAWWTVLVVDPIAMRVLPPLVPRRRITPDGLSLASLLLALLAGAAFLDERFVLGAVLFELHFVLDCLDGKLARLRRTSSPRGGFLDVACDLVGTAWCFATLGIAVFEGTSLATLALVAAVAHVVYTWSTLHRSKAGGLTDRTGRQGLAGWLQARRLVPTPGGVDTEAAVLFLLPLLSREGPIRVGLLAAAVFLGLLAARNLRSTYRVLGSA